VAARVIRLESAGGETSIRNLRERLVFHGFPALFSDGLYKILLPFVTKLPRTGAIGKVPAMYLMREIGVTKDVAKQHKTGVSFGTRSASYPPGMQVV
jgi:hypothetical protein